MKIVATYNIKGGVGKTAAAVNLSYLAAADGQRVLLADLDPQAAASFLFRVRPRVKGGGAGLIRGNRELDKAIKGTDFDGLDLLPADFTFRNLDLILDTTKKPTQRLARLLRGQDRIVVEEQHMDHDSLFTRVERETSWDHFAAGRSLCPVWVRTKQDCQFCGGH